jgi:hypothetical protein
VAEVSAGNGGLDEESGNDANNVGNDS